MCRGPTGAFAMRSIDVRGTRLATPQGLAQIWRHDLLPLLEEHYYGRMTRAEVHQRFGLDTIPGRVASAPAGG